MVIPALVHPQEIAVAGSSRVVLTPLSFSVPLERGTATRGDPAYRRLELGDLAGLRHAAGRGARASVRPRRSATSSLPIIDSTFPDGEVAAGRAVLRSSHVNHVGGEARAPAQDSRLCTTIVSHGVRRGPGSSRREEGQFRLVQRQGLWRQRPRDVTALNDHRAVENDLVEARSALRRASGIDSHIPAHQRRPGLVDLIDQLQEHGARVGVEPVMSPCRYPHPAEVAGEEVRVGGDIDPVVPGRPAHGWRAELEGVRGARRGGAVLHGLPDGRASSVTSASESAHSRLATEADVSACANGSVITLVVISANRVRAASAGRLNMV